MHKPHGTELREVKAGPYEPDIQTALDDRAPAGQGPLRDPRQRFLAALLLVAVGVAGATWLVASRAKSPRQVASEASAPKPSAILAPVELRVLRRVVPVRGTVVAPAARKIMVEPSDQSGTPIATAAPLRLGALVEEGTVVAEIALRPVIVLSGDIPMFRDLSVASAGRDVLQLQQALVRRGLTPETDGVLGPQTVDAVAKLYAFRGYAPPNPGAQTGRGARGGPVVLKSEVIFVRGLPARLLGRPLRVGQTVQGAVARLSSGGVFVRAEATSADRGDIRIGSRATIRVSGRGVSGRVTAIGALTRKRDSDLRAHPLTIQPTKPLPRRLLDRSVQVIISARATRGRTLVVPVAAISAGADGSARLTRVRADETTPVRVRPGLSANGYVSVRTQPGDLRPGDQVVVGR